MSYEWAGKEKPQEASTLCNLQASKSQNFHSTRWKLCMLSLKKIKNKKILSDFDRFKVLNCLTATAFSFFYLHFSVSWAFGKLVYNCFNNSFVKLRASLLCDFIMNPLVCQPDDGPPAKKTQCTSNRPYKLYFKIVCHERWHLLRKLTTAYPWYL